LVSVILPARNEAHNIERCVHSLLASRYPAFEVIVVDDRSTDATSAIAERLAASDPRLRVVHGAERPDSWFGKPWACWQGFEASKGAVLLFTDADTEHMEGSLAAAVAEIERANAALLSYSPEQHLSGIRQQLLMPLIFAELAVAYSPRRINDPATPDAAANGQYILVRAASHQRLGGFGEVATELLEDVALARLYKQKGYVIRFRMGRGLVRTHMYGSWEELEAGWTKNLALLFPQARRLACRRMIEFCVLLLLPAMSVAWTAMVLAMENRTPAAAGALHWLLVAVGILLWLLALSRYALLYARVSRAHFPFWPSLLSFLGLPWFAALLRRSAAAHEQGSVCWRGRDYATRGEAKAGAAKPSRASNRETR